MNVQGMDGLSGKCIVARAVAASPIDDDALTSTISARLTSGTEARHAFALAGGARGPIDDDAPIVVFWGVMIAITPTESPFGPFGPSPLVQLMMMPPFSASPTRCSM
jgi:hypothetical protein